MVSTLVMVTLDVMIGRAVGTSIGKRAELLGGVVLISLAAPSCMNTFSAAA
jgi:putative Mn2+ efflux pump MntP